MLPHHMSPVIQQVRDGRLTRERAAELTTEAEQRFKQQIEPCLERIEEKIDADLANLDQKSRSEAEQNLESYRRDRKFDYVENCMNELPDAHLCNSLNDNYVKLLKLQ